MIIFLVSSQAALQAQISNLSTSQSSSSTEVDNLKHRVEDTEREKRDLVGVISRLKQDNSQREGTYSTSRASPLILTEHRGNTNSSRQPQGSTGGAPDSRKPSAGTTVDGNVHKGSCWPFSRTFLTNSSSIVQSRILDSAARTLPEGG
jgi:hypothetical protein